MGNVTVNLIVAVLATLIALWLDRWLSRGKRRKQEQQLKKETLLEEIGRMQEMIHDVLQKLDEGARVYSEQDRLSRAWRALEKRIPADEKMKLDCAYQNARSSLSDADSGGQNDAKRMMRNFQNALEGVYRRTILIPTAVTGKIDVREDG